MKAIIRKIIRPIRHILRQYFTLLKIEKIIKTKKTIFLEIGAGNKKGKNSWLTVDMTMNCDIYWDLRKGIPFPDKSITKIYSSHFLEHLSYKEGQLFLDECLRVMVSGGEFSICVPNTALFIEKYLNSTPNPEKLLKYPPAFNNTTKIDYLNYIAYMDEQHKYMFDQENLLYILKEKGFQGVTKRNLDSQLDLATRDSVSIYAFGYKL